MEGTIKNYHRKSKAPWQNAHVQPPSKANPYANANNSQTSVMNTLQVPGSNPYGGLNNAASAASRKHNRRMSIHASAQAHSHGRSFSSTNGFDTSSIAPPVPKLGGVGGSNGDNDDVENILDKISRELGNASALEIDEFDKVLKKQHQVVSTQIKDNINENQKQILQLTHDLKDIQQELVLLRVQRKLLYDVLDDFRDSAQKELDLENLTQQSSSLVAPAKKRDRSSVLVLQKMWATELQSLFKHVDGASKYIQSIPGRHVNGESGRWHEVNVGTWKPVKPTHLFILNDLVLIAVKKSSQEGSKSRLQAVQCWPLNDVTLTPIEVPQAANKSSENRVYLINIKYKSLSYVYQTDRIDHFMKITEAFQKGRDELLQNERLQSAGKLADFNEKDHEKKQLHKSLRNSGIIDSEESKRTSGSHKRRSTDVVLQDISARVHSRNRSHDFGTPITKYSHDKNNLFVELKSLEDKIDDVDVDIAHNQYSQAVGFIAHIEGKLKNIDAAARRQGKEPSEEISLLLEVVKMKIDSRRTKVLQGLNFTLQNNISRLSEDEIENTLCFFESFGELDKGINNYLYAMSNHLSSIMSRLTVEVQGSTKIDVFNFLANLVVIHITLIKRVVLLYNNKIKNILKGNEDANVDSSGLMNWCMEELSKLSTQINKQLYGTILDSTINVETDQPQFHVKDDALFKDFIDVLIPQLDGLKEVGINADFKFEAILELQTV
jgi:hypothetical protein